MVASTGEQDDAALEVLASVTPDVRILRWVRAGALGVLAVGVAIAIVFSLPQFAVVAVAVGLVAAATFNRGNVVAVTVTSQGLEIAGQDGVARSIPGHEIGGFGVSGTVIGGRLVAVSISWMPAGRLVVVNPEGRVICARRAGWLRVADLEQLARQAGRPWIGSRQRAVPGASLRFPTDMAGPVGPARTDAQTVAAVAKLKRHFRRVGHLVWGVLLSGIICLSLMGGLASGNDVRGYLGWAGFLGLVGFLFGAPVAEIYCRPGSVIPKILKDDQPWLPVEAIVMAGLVANPMNRTVGIVEPVTGKVAWWIVDRGGDRGWLQGDDRTAFWFLPALDGKKALIAPPDRSEIALLEHRLLSKSVQAEADAAVRSESGEWQHRHALYG